MIDYVAVLTSRHAGRVWQLDGNDYTGLTMLDGGTKPTKKSLDDAWFEVQAEIAATADRLAAVRASALSKLAALGLTADEIAALIGA